MNVPERIWAWKITDKIGSSHGWNTYGGHGAVECIRADTVAEMIRQAVQAEREACAKVCERKNSTGEHDDDGYWMEFDAHETARVIARTIRARGEA